MQRTYAEWAAHYRTVILPARPAKPREVGSIYEAPEALRSLPHQGRRGKKAGTRELVLSPLPWIVIYTVRDAIDIVRILHGAQRWP